MKKNKINSHGITLIALIISIIVLLILAAISINTLIGENGIITKAQEAANALEQSQNQEEEVLKNIENSMNEAMVPYNASIQILNEDEIVKLDNIYILVKHNMRYIPIDLENCKYVLTDSSENLGTNTELYTGGTFTAESEEITIVAPNEEGIYYLHVITMDTLGYVTETVSDSIVILDHIHIYTSNITPLTCTSNGYTTYSCIICEDQYIDNEIVATGHDTNTITLSATCTEDGYIQDICTKCNEIITNTAISALGHETTSQTVAATCIAAGYTKVTCTRCDETISNTVIAVLGHSTTSTTVAATCTAAGYTKVTCTRCDETISNTVIAATGHTTSTTTVAAKCSTGGYTKVVCTKCGTTTSYTTTAATGHSSSCYTTGTCGARVWNVWSVDGDYPGWRFECVDGHTVYTVSNEGYTTCVQSVTKLTCTN